MLVLERHKLVAFSI